MNLKNKIILSIFIFSIISQIFSMENSIKNIPDDNQEVDVQIVDEDVFYANKEGPQTAQDYLEGYIKKLNLYHRKKYTWRPEETLFETTLDLFKSWQLYRHEFLPVLNNLIKKHLSNANFNPLKLNEWVRDYLKHFKLENINKINDSLYNIEHKKNLLRVDEEVKKFLITLNENELFNVNLKIEITSENDISSRHSSYSSRNQKNNKFEYMLHRAAAANRADWIIFFCEQLKANINVKNSEKETPLLVAIKNGSWQAAFKLLEFENIDVNIANDNLETPLSAALESENLELISLLLEKDAILAEKESIKNNNNNNNNNNNGESDFDKHVDSGINLDLSQRNIHRQQQPQIQSFENNNKNENSNQKNLKKNKSWWNFWN